MTVYLLRTKEHIEQPLVLCLKVAIATIGYFDVLAPRSCFGFCRFLCTQTFMNFVYQKSKTPLIKKPIHPKNNPPPPKKKSIPFQRIDNIEPNYRVKYLHKCRFLKQLFKKKNDKLIQSKVT